MIELCLFASNNSYQNKINPRTTCEKILVFHIAHLCSAPLPSYFDVIIHWLLRARSSVMSHYLDL